MFLLKEKLFLSGCANRTCVCARTAANALVSIDYVFAITFGDATGRTCILASAAADALIGNFVCHFDKPPFKVVTYILSYL